MEYDIGNKRIYEGEVMPQFKRFVAYLYYYENDTKEYLAGFAKVEMRGGICRLEIHLKGTEYAGQEGKVSLFIRREGKILTFPVGSMRLMSQSSDYTGRISEGELGDETCHMQDVCGILIQPGDGNFYGSQWDDGEIHKEEIEVFRAASRDKVSQNSANQNATDQNPSSQSKESQKSESQNKMDQNKASQETKEEDKKMEAAEEQSLQTEEVPMRCIFSEQQSMEKCIRERNTQEKGTGEKEASIWEHWENLKRKMTILHPFEGENITCVHMELRDLRELPQKYWYLGNNSFLLHGFFNYRYLFFGEQVTPEGRELFLAVPGVYQKPEKVMAAIFGFPQFRTEKPCQQLEGTFGYWYRRMDE
jgi:hypothetical protein